MKSRGTTIALAFFLGGLGIHRFYLNQAGIGILYVLLACMFISPFLALFDVVYFLLMSDETFHLKYNSDYDKIHGIKR